MVQPLIDNLHSNGRLRVWSLVVTILGDAVQPRGGRISMTDLLTITGHMGIESGAIRTALSRLSKDGWVESKREGRVSSYTFGPAGRDSFGPASARIYAPVGTGNVSDWRVALLPNLKTGERKKLRQQLQATDALVAQSNFALWPLPAAPDIRHLQKMGCLIFDGAAQNIPDWLQSELAPTEVAKAYAEFSDDYLPLLNKPDRLAELSPLDAMTLRILMIHKWRRLVLRHPRIPANLQPAGWPVEQAKAVVADIYIRILSPSEAFWDQPCPSLGLAVLDARFRSAGQIQ